MSPATVRPAGAHRAEHTLRCVQLPDAVVAPTHHRAACSYSAAVPPTSAHHVERSTRWFCPAVVPVAPTPDRARVQQNACMDRARRDRRHARSRLRCRTLSIRSNAKRCERNYHRSPNSRQPRHTARSRAIPLADKLGPCPTRVNGLRRIDGSARAASPRASASTTNPRQTLPGPTVAVAVSLHLLIRRAE